MNQILLCLIILALVSCGPKKEDKILSKESDLKGRFIEASEYLLTFESYLQSPEREVRVGEKVLKETTTLLRGPNVPQGCKTVVKETHEVLDLSDQDIELQIKVLDIADEGCNQFFYNLDFFLPRPVTQTKKMTLYEFYQNDSLIKPSNVKRPIISEYKDDHGQILTKAQGQASVLGQLTYFEIFQNFTLSKLSYIVIQKTKTTIEATEIYTEIITTPL